MMFLSTFWEVTGAAFIVLFVVLPLLIFWGFAVADLFMRRVSAWHRVLWLLAIIVFPIIGPIVYILVHPVDKTREDLLWEQAQVPTVEQPQGSAAEHPSR